MDDKGQLSIELIFLVGILTIVLVLSSIFILHEHELTTAMTAARNGVNEAITLNSIAVYPIQTFNEYEMEKEKLLYPRTIKLVHLNYTKMNYEMEGKEKIQFNVSVTTPDDLSNSEKDALGERINFYLRKSVANSFNSENLTNKLYNPVFSNHYIYTTANVKWV